MGKYECIDFSKKLKLDFFVKYIKNSSEYKEILDRMMALDYKDAIDFWIKRDNYSLLVRLSNLNNSIEEYEIKYILFVSLNIFCENKNIYLPDLEFPIVIVESDCDTKTCKNLKIYGKVVAKKGIFNNFYFETVSFYGATLELVDDIKDFNFLSLIEKFNTLNKMHYLEMFLNGIINYFRHLYVSTSNTSKEFNIIKLNNIGVNCIDLRISKWFNDCLDKDIFMCLDEIGIKVNNCYLSIIGSINSTSTLNDYENSSIQIINNLKKFSCFNLIHVTFIPSMKVTNEEFQIFKDKLMGMSTENLLIKVYVDLEMCVREELV